ncbi:MAG: flavin reductase family protein [Candidatus Lokiarchaeota archaeon]|nr:flavin reductase family protein [Candidatus Lokiarchaeota archaeon]
MKKIPLNTGISAFPMPAAVISVGIGEEANLITLAYVGKVCLQPPIIAISMQPRRHSYGLIEKHREFVINYPTKEQLKEMDYCGTRSGRDVNKWKELNLTKEQGIVVKVPMVKEFPWNMECKVIKRIEFGSHVCYFGEVVATHSDEKFVTNNKLDAEKFSCFAYINGNYIGLENRVLETHGFSMK